MAEIISVRFRSEGKQYYFDPQGMVCRPGDGLIVETASGLEYAQCVRGNFTLAEAELAAPLRPVVRAATEEDLAVVEKNREKEVYAFRVCQEKILEHKLDMKLVSVECSFEGTKILFFFTSDGRVTLNNMVITVTAANRFTDQPAAFTHFTISNAIRTAADSCKHRTFKQPLHIYYQIKFFRMQ